MTVVLDSGEGASANSGEATRSKEGVLPLDLEKIARLVELMKQRVLVGDGQFPLLRDGDRSPIDFRSVQEYSEFLKESAVAIQTLRQEMSEEETKAADAQYGAWYQSYLQEE